MSKPQELVPMIILGSGVLFAVIGAGLLVAGQALIGVIFVAVGVTDAITSLVFRRRLEGRKGSTGAAPVAKPDSAEESGEHDPSYNPYARED